MFTVLTTHTNEVTASKLSILYFDIKSIRDYEIIVKSQIFSEMSSNNTINLEDSAVLSSTKDSSVLEVSEDSVVDIDSSDTEGEDEVNSTSENVDSSSDRLIRENSKEMSRAEVMSEDEMGDQTREHFVTGYQSPDQSSVYSATLLMSNLSSNQVSSSLLTVFSLTTPRLPRTSQVS